MNAQITTWNAGEADAYRLFSRWSREQALAIAAWDRDSLLGKAVGPRPVATPATELQSRARESVQ